VTKRHGHFCWCCGRTRPNERFSGRCHARHLCKDCQKLGGEELAFRQAVRDIDRMLQRETARVKQKQRKNFERFLRHPNERIRRYAESVVVLDPALDVEGGGFADWDANELVWEEGEGRGAG